MNTCPKDIGYIVNTHCALKTTLEDQYRNLLYKTARLKHDYIEPRISFQEMQAIHLYTTEWSRLINGILRGTVNIHKENSGVFKFALIQAIFCASGLNKLPKTQTEEPVFRGEEYNDPKIWPLAEKILMERIEAAEVKGVVNMKGFISTTTDPNSFCNSIYSNAPISLNIIPSKGAYIAPISANPDEKEFLIPPTRMRITMCEYGGRLFSAQPVSDLNTQETGSYVL